MDDVDLRIVAELIADGRLPLAEVARRVNLSSPAVADRVRRLERDGVITGYAAAVDARRLGYALTAIVRVRPSPGQLGKVARLADSIPEVIECQRTTGDDCFVLTVCLRTIEELAPLLDRILPYGQTTTSIVNATPVPRRPPPLPSAGAL